MSNGGAMNKATGLLLLSIQVAGFTAATNARSAETALSDRTECSQIGPIKDSQDQNKINEFYNVVIGVMEGLDQKHVRDGEPDLLASLTYKARLDFVAMTATYCRENPRIPLSDAASYVYQSTRDLLFTLGAVP